MILPNSAHSNEGSTMSHDWRPEVLVEINKYLLTGKVDQLPRLCPELLGASVRLELPGLKFMCVKSILDNLSPENVMDSLVLLDQYHFTEMVEYVLNYIVAHFEEIVETPGDQYYGIKLD